MSAPAHAPDDARAPQPTRSNRVLTEELLRWKQRCADLEDELDATHERLTNADDYASGAGTDQTVLVAQLQELQRARERDRRAMRQRVRALETHMIDTRIEDDSRYWRLLTSSSDKGGDQESAHVQLVVQQNEITRLRSVCADYARRLREAREQAAFLIGLQKWRGAQLQSRLEGAAAHAQRAQGQAGDRERMAAHVADLERRLDRETAARQEAERALAVALGAAAPPLARDAPDATGLVSPAPLQLPVRGAPSWEDAAGDGEVGIALGGAMHTSVGAHMAAGSPPPQVLAAPVGTPGARAGDAAASPLAQPSAPGAQTAGSVSPPLSPPRPHATPLPRRAAAVTAASLDVEATPMLARMDAGADEEVDEARTRKKRRLVGGGPGFFKLNEMRAASQVADADIGDTPPPARSLSNVRLGRGGVGNVRSPSRDPVERRRMEEAESRELDAQEALQRQELEHHVHATGRGGLGNLPAHAFDSEEERGRAASPRGRGISPRSIATSIRSLSRSRSREPRASREPSLPHDGRGSGRDASRPRRALNQVIESPTGE
ncbi:hypothetical protein MSPP1_000975 [Malassezia sp. CBS 17886]|nr:hypothetical protein MSPP1_000975 [Malassezia sp. CBS 17886]